MQDNPKAIEYYSKAAQYDSKNASLYWERGKLYDQEQEYGKARADYQEAIKLSPGLKGKVEPVLKKIASYLDQDAKIYEDKGKDYLSNGELPKALEYYTKALESNPEYVEVYVKRGLVYQMLGQYDKAVQDYSEAISLRRSEPQYYFYRAVSYQYLGDYPKALTDLQQALNYNAFYHAACHRQGLIWAEQKDYDKAIVCYLKAIKMAEVSSYYADLALAYTKMKQYDRATAQWQRARELQK
jgi:tetratricopeptide (TPR) repeat protein